MVDSGSPIRSRVFSEEFGFVLGCALFVSGHFLRIVAEGLVKEGKGIAIQIVNGIIANKSFICC